MEDQKNTVLDDLKSPMMLISIFALLILVGFVGHMMWKTVSTSAPADTSARDAREAAAKDELWVEHGKSAVRARLKDPSSATFRNAGVRRQTGTPLVCGEVNAANSFGGKGGFQRFIFMGSALGVILQEDMDPQEFVSLWNQSCTK